jgi:septal ring-binding cell division protein DamX
MASSAEISAASPVARGARPPDAETQPATTTPSPVSPAPTRRAVRNRSTASEAKAAVDASLPKYLRLAYRPREAVAIIDLPEDFWTVQLIALGSAEALEAYAQKEGLRGMSAAKISANGKLYYVLLLGVYETKANAVEAAEDLGPPFENPWVRSLGSLQKAMLAADRLNPPG